MRTDLTAGFISAKNASFRRPRQLLVFKFPEAGNVYISDQKLGAADGLSNEYQPLVESWGELQDSAGDATAADNGEIRQMTVTLWNGGENPFSDYFLAEYPENVEAELYQWFAGLPESSKALIDRFVVQDPIEFDEASRLLTLDLVSLSILYEQPCGELITREAWPYAADSDIGKGIPQAFGNTGRIPALKGKTTQTLRLHGSVLANTMVLPVYENLDDLLFPATGTVIIEEEKIRYSGRTASALTVIQRGYLSAAVEHLDKREIISVISDYTFPLCAGPVASIANVMIEGFPAPAGIYTVRPDLDPARVIFSEKPWVKKYGESTRFLEMQFDGITTSNTALQPANAYDAADLATAACIKPGNAVLGLRQVTANTNRGEILKAYLAVEHWASGKILADFCEVWVSGVGVVGRLSRPNPNDELALDADVDIDHPHQHSIGAEHRHTYNAPVVAASNPLHGHASTVSGATVHDSGLINGSSGYPFLTFVYLDDKVLTLTYGATGPQLSQSIRIRFLNLGAGNIRFRVGGTVFPTVSVTWQSSVEEVDQTINLPPGTTTAYLDVYHGNIVNGGLRLMDATISSQLTGAISNTGAGVTASVTNPGSVANQGADLYNEPIKAADDVANLATANRAVNIETQANPSRTVVNLFDLTSFVNFNWAWFTSREVKVTYTNAGDNQAVYILHAFFDVEYVPTEVVYSDEITAEVTSLSDCIRPDLAIKKLLTTRAGVAAADFDSASFTAIAAKFTERGYRLDGLIEADATLRDAIKRICYQSHSRFFTSGGKLKMVLREGHPASKPVTRQLTADNLQLRSISASRQPMREISNRVQLFFKRDWTASDSSTSGFLDSVTREDAGSIGKFGLKAKADSYNFDLIRDIAMAGKVADFYLMTDAWPSTFYTFQAYLDQFDLEKEDLIEVSAGFNQMNKVPMVVRAMNRQFGSGKNSSINLLRIVAENLFYLLSKVSRTDAVLIMDALSIMITEIGDYAEVVHALEQLVVRLNVSRTDEAAVADLLLVIWEMRQNLAEAVTATAAVHADQTSERNDTVVIGDFPEAWSVYGFGSGGFGQVPFGGLSAWKQKHPDQISIFERLITALSVYRASAVVPSETLLIGSGFGGKLSSGFGLSPFGG
jgi:predicted DNA-binding protein